MEEAGFSGCNHHEHYSRLKSGLRPRGEETENQWHALYDLENGGVALR
jgi:hypothetical protein